MLLGFWHVADTTAVMAEGWMRGHHHWIDEFNSRERYHVQLAYEVGRGEKYRGWPFLLPAPGFEPPLLSLPPPSLLLTDRTKPDLALLP